MITTRLFGFFMRHDLTRIWNFSTLPHSMTRHLLQRIIFTEEASDDFGCFCAFRFFLFFFLFLLTIYLFLATVRFSRSHVYAVLGTHSLLFYCPSSMSLSGF